MSDKPQKIPIIELFGPTIQGEGAMIGQQTMFVRTGGCDFRCTMCDSMHAVEPSEIRKRARYMTCDEISDELLGQMKGADWVTLSGGNPCLWELGRLIANIHRQGFKVAVETQGTYWKDWVRECDVVTISPKGPGMGEKCDFDVLHAFYEKLRFRRGLNFKVVCFCDGDLELARRLRAAYPTVPLYLSVGNSFLPGDVTPLTSQRITLLARLRWLAETVVKDPSLARTIVLPQLHVLIWGNEKER